MLGHGRKDKKKFFAHANRPYLGALRMRETIIRVEGLSYRYSTRDPQALKDVSLEIYRGEYIAILGANGAGKTTFCLHMNGVLPLMLGGRMGGTIHVLGKEPYEHHIYENAHKVGMVLQDPESQLFSSDVLSEAAFAAENQGMPRDEMIKRIKWGLGIVRLSDYANSSPSELSGGQKQRLVIAANLVTHPEILVLDEPTSQLDPVGTAEVFSTLRDLNKQYGMTILVATHQTDQVAEYADRIMVLEDGKLIAFDEPRKVYFDTGKMKHALVNIPEVAELDQQIRSWAIVRSKDDFGSDNSQANVTLSQVKESLEGFIRKGIITPLPSFQRGLGRHISEELESQEADPILEVSNVSFGYSKNAPPSIQGISLSIKRGEIVGMIGQNGAGKTTLMKCITGVFKPSTGTVKIEGKNVSKLSGLERSKSVGLILQNPDNQLFQMSSREEIAFGLKNLQLPQDEIARRIDEVLQLTGMEKYKEEYPFKLSLGDRRKLTVASIYAMHPSILIFDEPTTGQDYLGRYQLCDLAVRLNRLGATIIMISHDMSLIAKYTQRTLVMGKGSILLDAPTREVFSHRDILKDTFLEPPPIVRMAQELEPLGVPRGVLTVEELYNALTGDVITAEQQVYPQLVEQL
jgi:energy-coupling factor transport system ATP-binding protein